MYQLTKTNSIIRLADGACIPADNANTDYQEYLSWLEAGGVPEDVLPPTQAETYLAWKAQREQLVAQIVVEVDGMTFDGDEESQNRMVRAVAAADLMSETTEWTLADNTVVTVTVQQLKTACRLAGEEQTRIWNEGRPA